ncbi:Ferroptosis suppressor protein 1 [Psilocybe cubensis]|uniref:FAD/NAD(P)-binding domain-containing protein n=2 Tax=Psilocybe cubensis TaxID=181762 RepID=A0A8H7XX50_PSICU|nr:Ferroptosis suppressor protein 1 [Psilocybe cubensis]KAH9476010.1 Ferroptosis suppressor protein 1 [Psilocybe cubensis]
MSASTSQNIVIVGAGFGGLTIYNELVTKVDSSKYNLILINNRSFFTHRPAGLRLIATAEGKLEDTALIPLKDSRFNTGNRKLVVGEVTSIVDDDTKGHYVVLNSGEQIDFSILILSPGSNWDGPLAFGNTKAEIVELATTWRTRFEKANDIVIVGGGSIGLELAGEIKDLDQNKNVTIVHAQPLLLNDSYPERWRRRTAKDLEARGVNLVLGEYVDEVEVVDGKVSTRSKKSIKADLVVPTRGPSPNTKFIESLGSEVLNAKGYIKVLPTLQLPQHERIFALGDAIDWNEQKQAAKIRDHAPAIVNNVLFLLGEKKSLIQYKGALELIVLTNGKNGGSGYIGILWGIVVGNWFARMVKSRDLLVERSATGLQLQ